MECGVTNLVPDYNHWYICPKCRHQTPLHVKEWVGLTEAERMDILDAELTTQSTEHFALAQAIEAKLKEKNT